MIISLVVAKKSRVVHSRSTGLAYHTQFWNVEPPNLVLTVKHVKIVLGMIVILVTMPCWGGNAVVNVPDDSVSAFQRRIRCQVTDALDSS